MKFLETLTAFKNFKNHLLLLKIFKNIYYFWKFLKTFITFKNFLLLLRFRSIYYIWDLEAFITLEILKTLSAFEKLKTLTTLEI